MQQQQQQHAAAAACSANQVAAQIRRILLAMTQHPLQCLSKGILPWGCHIIM
jgi:hypothetical protein